MTTTISIVIAAVAVAALVAWKMLRAKKSGKAAGLSDTLRDIADKLDKAHTAAESFKLLSRAEEAIANERGRKCD